MTFKEPLLLARSTAETITLTTASYPSLFSGSHKTDRLSRRRRNHKMESLFPTFSSLKRVCCQYCASFCPKCCLKRTASPKTLQMTLCVSTWRRGKRCWMCFLAQTKINLCRDVQGLVTANGLPPKTEVVSIQIWDSPPGSPTDVGQGL